MTKFIVLLVKPNGKVKRCKDNGCKVFASYEHADDLRKALSSKYPDSGYYVLPVPDVEQEEW